MIAVRTDGTTVWDVPTGLGAATAPDQSPIGLAWVPNADAIVGLTRDGFVFLLDRRTGAPLLSAPCSCPGERTPPDRPRHRPAPSLAAVDALLAPLVAFPDRLRRRATSIDVLLGGNSEVANNLSVDPRTGRLWIAASARDGEDGTVDGVSELGAVYRFDVVPRRAAAGRSPEVCHRSFPGGSASTPTLGQNGTRVYLGDDAGRADRDRRRRLQRGVARAARLADLRLDRGVVRRTRALSPPRRAASSRCSTTATTAGAAGPPRSTSTTSRPTSRAATAA